MSGLVQTVPILSVLQKLWPIMIACDNGSEHKNGNLNFSVPILKVISHSPLLFIIVPLAALILMLLENCFVFVRDHFVTLKRQYTFTCT